MNAAYGALMSALPIYAGWRLLRDHKTRARWGAFARDIPVRFSRREARKGDRPCVWVHGVSVGEVKAAARLIEDIENTVPGVEVVVTVTTDTGNRVARRRYPDHRVEFYPPDFSWIVKDALDAIRPDLVLLVESEFWPNFLIEAHARGLPVALVNGKMSPRSTRRFVGLRALSAPLMRSLCTVCVQHSVYKERYRKVGVPLERLHVTGNMKFDNIPPEPDQERLRFFRGLLRLGSGVPVVVGGSTHPGEEEALARVQQAAISAGLQARWIVAPRHPARVDTVEQEMRRQGAKVIRRSRLDEGSAGPAPDELVLLDTVGELEHIYALADAVYIGGTLVPHGGQNMMEPASLGKPVVIGPHFHNFRGEVDMLKQADAIAICPDESTVRETLMDWLREPGSARDLGGRARREILASKGATDATIALLRPLLEPLIRA